MTFAIILLWAENDATKKTPMIKEKKVYFSPFFLGRYRNLCVDVQSGNVQYEGESIESRHCQRRSKKAKNEKHNKAWYERQMLACTLGWIFQWGKKMLKLTLYTV